MIYNPVVIKKTEPARSASLKDVNFFDYDGTLVYSYTLSEAQTLTSLPIGPVHDGLVFQGWNWPLEKVKALTRPMNVGAKYITDDGKTRLKIRVWDKAGSNVPLYISQTAANGVAIDWGDGSAAETLDGTGCVNTSHQYAEVGDYTISLAVMEGCTLGFGAGSEHYCVMGSSEFNERRYCNRLQEVNIGCGVTGIDLYSFNNCNSLGSISIPDHVIRFGGGIFRNCYALESVSIPDSAASIGGYLFQGCSSLKNISIPYDVTGIGNSMFQNCYSLGSIFIPDGVTSIGGSAFNACYSLGSVSIPDSVTVIGANAFANCYGMTEYHLKPVAPPTLSNVNAFSNIPSDCIIYVPAGSLEAYKTAENWSAYADHMREEPA